MKYCQYCGAQLIDDAKYCLRCGKEVPQASQNTTSNHEHINHSNSPRDLVNKLSVRLQTNGIIWVVIAVIQILAGLFGAWFTLAVGVLNIISAITDIKNSKRILSDPRGIVSTYEPIVNPIIVLVYNLVIGGVIGVIGSIYYLIFVRGFVMDNKNHFLAMEINPSMGANSSMGYNPATGTNPSMQTTAPISCNVTMQNETEIHIDVTLTIQEALNGTEKESPVPGLSQPLRVNFPKNTADGNIIAIRNVSVTTADGKIVKKFIYLKILIQK